MEDGHTMDEYYRKSEHINNDNNSNHNALPAPMAIHPHQGSGSGIMMNGPSPMMMGRGGFPRSSPFAGPMGNDDRGMDPSMTATISITSAYVGNLHPTTTKEELTNHFASCGPLRRVTIPIHPNGQVRGCGYVEFETPEGLNRAISQLHNSVLKGNTLEVYAKRDTHRRGGMGRGGMGRGGGYHPRGGMYGSAPIPMFMPQGYGMGGGGGGPYGMPSGYGPAQMGGMRPWGGRGHRGPITTAPYGQGMSMGNAPGAHPF